MEPFSHVRISNWARPNWRAWLCLGVGLTLPGVATALQGKSSPMSKIYVADVDGDVEIESGGRVDELIKKSVYNAQGVTIETMDKAFNAMVFSNGTGIFFDEDTRVEVKRFEQEPFLPSRGDMGVEPSISQTKAYLPRGTVGICTSQLVAGSSMTYDTPLAAVNVHGGKVVIEVRDGLTKISMLQGESTVNSGNINFGGQALEDGMQAIIRTPPGGGRPNVTIQAIPKAELRALEQKVSMACTARKTVYFGAVGSEAGSSESSAGVLAPESDSIFNAPASSIGSASPTGAGSITAFNGDGATPASSPVQNIVAVPVVPNDLPVEYTVSPANLTSTASAP